MWIGRLAWLFTFLGLALLLPLGATAQDEAVRLAKLILQKPDFPQDQFDNLKAQSISGLTAELASPTGDRAARKACRGRRLGCENPRG